MSGFCRSHRAVMRNSYSRSRYSIGDSSEHPSYWDDDDRVEPTLTHLEYHGYEFDEDDREWWILASSVKRQCRRDHKDGTIKAGQRYIERTYRYITDNPDSEDHRKSRRETTKTVLCASCDRAAWRCQGKCQQ